MSKESHYHHKSIQYGISHTRLKRVLKIAGNVAGKKILDIGCASGYVGAKLKERGATVVGIDISEPAVAAAREKLDSVFVFDLEKEWPDVGNNYDLAILPEIVEHVFDPKELLKNVAGRLAPAGQVIITTPNIMTWTNRAKFLLGHFRYTQQGIMDFGHIRFFTYEYLKEVLSESGFELEEEMHIIFPGKLTPLLKYRPSLFASQFIVRARKTNQ